MSHQARLARYGEVSTALGLLSDQRLGRLVDGARALGSGVGGASSVLDVAGVPVFVKRIPLTDLEREPGNVRSTGNVFGLPMGSSNGRWPPPRWAERSSTPSPDSSTCSGRTFRRRSGVKGVHSGLLGPRRGGVRLNGNVGAMPEELVCVGALITDADGRLFVQRRSMNRRLFPGAWDIVGGHVEAGEGLHEALRREVLEETGWQVTRIGPAAGTFGWLGNDGWRRVEHDYPVEVAGDLSAPRLEAGKHTEYRWITAAELDLMTVNRAVDADLLAWIAALTEVLRQP